MPKPPHTYADRFTNFSQAWFESHNIDVNRSDGPAFVQMQVFHGQRYSHMAWYNTSGQIWRTSDMTLGGPRAWQRGRIPDA